MVALILLVVVTGSERRVMVAVAGALGAATWGGASAPASHLFHSGHASFPFMTLQVGHPATSLVHFVSDAIFTGFTIEGQTGEPWKITVPFIGITHGASSTVLAPTYRGDEPFLYHHAPSHQRDGAVGGDATRVKAVGAQ